MRPSDKARKEFIDKYISLVKSLVQNSGIHITTVFAIAIVESSGKGPDGYYYPANSFLAQQANNLFGITAGSSWTGKVLLREDPPGSGNYLQFRSYPNKSDSFADFVNLITGLSRYRPALNQPFGTQVQLIHAGGYATDPKWPDTVRSVGMAIQPFLQKQASYSGASVIFTFLILAAGGGAIAKNAGRKKGK